MFGRLCALALRSARTPCAAAAGFLITSACVSDESKSEKRKPLQLLNPSDMTNEALIRQACTLSVNSSTQMLTHVLIAIHETSEEYRKSMSELMVLLEESILLITNSTSSALDEVEDLMVHQRNIVEEQRRLVLEFVTLMDYVEKMVTSAAETAFLAGAEYSSTLMCERLNSALNKVVEECTANKQTEAELLRLQEAYVVQLGELYKRHSTDEANNTGKVDPNRKNEIDFNQILPLDILDNLPVNENETDGAEYDLR